MLGLMALKAKTLECGRRVGEAEWWAKEERTAVDGGEVGTHNVAEDKMEQN